MTQAPADMSIEIAVPQRYKNFVVKRQYRWFGIIVPAALGGINLVYYLLCLAFHWTWSLHFQGDMILLLLGLVAYMVEARRPWRYEINERAIKLFRITSRSQLANMQEMAWTKTQVAGVEQAEWQGLPAVSLTVLPAFGYTYLLVYNLEDQEEVTTRVLPLIEKYRQNYRQELWADRLRS